MARSRFFPSLLWLAMTPATAAFADTVNLTILNPTQAGPEGSILTYVATVSAPTTNTGREYLTDDSITITSGPLTVDDDDFFNNFPFFLDPGDSFTGDLFTIAATPGSVNTVTTGIFDLQGGPDPGDEGFLASANFSAAVTPEPATLWLLGTGVVGGMALWRRERPGLY